MDRMACVDLPAFPLQLLLQDHPDWRDCPAAVVDRDRPQGEILWVNEKARARRVLPGMRYSAGLALARELRAGEISPKRIERAVSGLVRRLRYFTPHVEPSADEPGVFWLDASGLNRLHESLQRWAGLIRADLRRAGFASTIVVGFGRFGSYALARAKSGVVVLQREADERAAARRVPLERLAVRPEARDALHKLGVKTVGAFVDLPPEGIGKRFGPDLQRMHRLARGALDLPIQPELPEGPAIERILLDHAETDVRRLMIGVERLIGPLLETLAGRAHAAVEIQVGFRFESHGDHIESVRPAAPTLDERQLLELIRLRLQAVRKLPDGVSEIVLVGRGVSADPGQLQLFRERSGRDTQAAGRALARVRADLGDAAVVRARLREGHLPEGSFTWERMTELEPPKPREAAAGRLVRRVYVRPLPLAHRSRREPDGWMLRGLADGPVIRLAGPYVVSGGWWNRTVHREYHFAETQKGDLLWVYFDRNRRRWYLQGRVE
ncbi:MAG: DNA polymerase Y family protein [bacterium]|nr:DNA polymerase Y family protein [bacterium]